MMLPHQIRAARAACGWSRDDLAERAEVHRNTVALYETTAPALPIVGTRQSARTKVERALMASGAIEFVDGQLRIGTTPPS